MSDANEKIQQLATALDEIAIALNDWYAERKAAHETRAAAWRKYQETSLTMDPVPWVYAEETIRRDDADELEPIRVLMRKADAALALVEVQK